MAQDEDKSIKVKLRKAGWEVEISCQENQLKQAIESVLSSLNDSSLANTQQKDSPGTPQGNKTCRGLIVELWRESWFNQTRSLGVVHEEIGRRGYHYDRTAVSHALRDLVLENILTRQGSSRNYLYIQKRPSDLGHSVEKGEAALFEVERENQTTDIASNEDDVN